MRSVATRRLIPGLLVLLLAARPAAPFECEGVEPVSGDRLGLELVSNTLANPVDVQTPPGDTERIFVVEQVGRIRIIRIANDELVTTPFLDIRSRVTFGGERGLLGLAFHPRYAENGYFYVNYTRRGDGATVVERYQVSDSDPDTADPASGLVLLTFPQPFSNHNGGQLAFGPLDGYLYISTGDGGSGGDPQNNAQNPRSFLGKILRIDVDNPSGGKNYGIPPDNPWADPGDGVLDEIWALGLRNPWRFAFDPENGDIYIADVGQNAWEEIDYRPGSEAGGENYEWRRKEGNHIFNASTQLTVGTPTPPILEYPHSGSGMAGCSITGGVLYRGCRMPDLHGTYFFADFCRNWVRTFRIEDGKVTDLRDRTAELNEGILPLRLSDISAFGVDGRGEIYICDLDRSLFRVIPASEVNHPPEACVETIPSPPTVTLEGGEARITLDATCSTDGDDGTQKLTFEWRQTSGPDATILSPNAAVTEVVFTSTGIHRFRVTVSDGDKTDTALVTVTVEAPPEPVFRRGDANADGSTDISDAVTILVRLFTAGPPPICTDALDTDDNGATEITDAIFLLDYLFRGGPALPDPGPLACGSDPTPDELDCATQPLCTE